MIEYEECLRQGLLRKSAPSPNQARDQLAKAEVLLEEAKRAVKSESPNSAVAIGYAAMFDAARALLFRDGFREKSHACVVRYLEANYRKEIDQVHIDLLDEYRDRRHKVMYSTDYYPTMEEARRIVEFADDFIDVMGKLLRKKGQGRR